MTAWISQLKRAFCDILGLRECDEPGDSISRRNFDPPLWTPQREATDGDMSKESVKEGQAGTPVWSGIQLFIYFSFLLIRTWTGLGLGLGFIS